MNIRIKNKTIIIYLIFLISCNNDSANSSKSFLFEKYEEYYQKSSSDNGNFLIYSSFDNISEKIEIKDSRTCESTTILYNTEELIFDPVVNNSRNYAYAKCKDSWIKSTLIVDGKDIDTYQGLYSLLKINSRYLVGRYSNSSENLVGLFIYNLYEKSIYFHKLDVIPSKILFISDNIFAVEYFCIDTATYNVGEYNITSKLFLPQDRSDKISVFLDKINDSSIMTVSFKNLYDIGLYRLKREFEKNDPYNNLMGANNYLGRLSWNASYRLEGLIKLYLSYDNYKSYQIYDISLLKEIILKSIYKALENREIYNGRKRWVTKRYSLDGKSKLDLLVDEAKIVYPLMLAVNNNIVSLSLEEEILNQVESLYDENELCYDNDKHLYKFEKNIKFWADGVWVPFNIQNIFGLVLIEMYKKTNKEKYKKRVFELASCFKKEWLNINDDEIVWHYWPSIYYKGWSTSDNISINTPSKKPSSDNLYEDIMHAGENIKFVQEFYSQFPDTIFNFKDISNIIQIIERVKYENNYSRFISGDIEYQKPERSFMPTYEWTQLNSIFLNDEVISGTEYLYAPFEVDNKLPLIDALQLVSRGDETQIKY